MYRILQIEDMPSDAYLVSREVKKVLGPCKFLVVDDRQAMQEALADFKPHLILSDVSIPGFNWHSALDIKRTHAPETPFVVVSGAISESVRKECIGAGADAFVNKNQIRELEQVLRAVLRPDQSDPSS